MADTNGPPRWSEPDVDPGPGSDLGPDRGMDDTIRIGRATVRPEDERPDLPYIDPEELSALKPISAEPAARIRRVLPLTDEPSTLVARYMFPTERYRGEWRRHHINLVIPVAVGVGVTIGLGFLAGFLAAQVAIGWLVPLTILVWLATMGWVAWQVAFWHFDRFILTNKRVMKISGIITRNVAMMPLLRVTDMKYEQTPLGRILNYGTFVIESAGQDQALREVPYLPSPNELYLRVVEEMYDPGAVEERVDRGDGGDEEDERHPGGDA